MPTARRAQIIGADAADVWGLLDDPSRRPDWWPDVRRVESVRPDGFTEVLYSSRARPVRIDLRIAERDTGRRLSWEQEIPGTPFERHLVSSVTVVSVEPHGDVTRVTIESRQQLRGMSRAGGWMLRRASGRRLESALAGLAELLDGSAQTGV